MTENPGQLLRLGLLGLIGGILQLVIVPQVSCFGTNADLAPLLVGEVALLVGPVLGSAFGFSLGLFIDLALFQTLGVSSLVLLLIGYWAGRFRELRDPTNVWAPAIIGIGATIAYGVIYAVVQFSLGVQAPVSWLLLRDIVASTCLNGLMAFAVFSLIRRALFPAGVGGRPTQRTYLGEVLVTNLPIKRRRRR